MAVNTSAMDVRINITSIHLDCTAMTTAFLTNNLSNTRKVFSLFFLTGLSLPQIALACSCVPEFNENLKFVSANYLPADAKGVLLMRKTPEDYRQVYIAHQTIIVASRPPVLSEQSAFILDKTSNRTIPAKIHNIELPQIWPQKTGLRYLMFKEALPLMCFKNWERVIESVCNPLKELNNAPEEIAKRIEQGLLIDISSTMSKSFGLFRIEPIGGFTENHQYVFSLQPEIRKFYKGDKLDEEEFGKLSAELAANLRDQEREYSFGVSKSLAVKIGPAVGMPKSADFQIKKLGQVQARTISLPSGGGSCGEQANLPVQDLAFVIPDSYQAYANSLQYFWQRQSNKLPFHFFQYRSGNCSQSGFNQSELPRGKEMLYKENNSYRVRGYAGFLELDDQLHLTPEIEVTLQIPTSSEQSDKK